MLLNTRSQCVICAPNSRYHQGQPQPFLLSIHAPGKAPTAVMAFRELERCLCTFLPFASLQYYPHFSLHLGSLVGMGIVKILGIYFWLCLTLWGGRYIVLCLMFLEQVVVLGDKGVGKTCLVLRFIEGYFAPKQQSTIGAFFLTKQIT